MTTFQDWKKVVLKKDIKTKQKIHPNISDNNDTPNITYSGVLLGKAITAARLKCKLSQSALDQKCNFRTNTVNSYELGTCVYNHAQVDTLARVLNTPLPRPKRTKT
jgi:ribosome-binding protein aMBF1 (putative translation factor)